MFKNVTFIMMLAISPLSAQGDTGTVTIPRAALTETQKAALETSQLKEKAQAYGSWVGVGKEIGEAVNSSLSAIGDNASKFADTKAGRFTMGIVIWKVLGNDLLGILYTIIIVFVGLPVLMWSYKKHMSGSVLKEEVFDDKGKLEKRIYRTLDYSERGAQEVIIIFHAVGAGVLLIAMSFALFG